MPEGPRNLRTDTALTRDPEVAGRFHADIPEGWKVVYVFGGVTMYTALRADARGPRPRPTSPS